MLIHFYLYSPVWDRRSTYPKNTSAIVLDCESQKDENYCTKWLYIYRVRNVFISFLTLWKATNIITLLLLQILQKESATKKMGFFQSDRLLQ